LPINVSIFIPQGKVCDVSAVDCSVGLGMQLWVGQSDFCGFWYSFGTHSRWLGHTEPVL